MENIEDLWQNTLEMIKEKVSKPSYDTWLKNTLIDQIQEDTVIISAPNEFTRDWLESKYTKIVKEVLYELTGADLSVKFIIPESAEILNAEETQTKKKAIISSQGNHTSPKSMLNDKYTFETFVIGSGNRFAHAASLAVAEAPAKAYNPLFIYGGRWFRKNTPHACNWTLCSRS